jgi:hypothetical protein
MNLARFAFCNLLELPGVRNASSGRSNVDFLLGNIVDPKRGGERALPDARRRDEVWAGVEWHRYLKNRPHDYIKVYRR